jgi:hypothetical protein
MGDSTSSYATAGIALRVSGAPKPHHHDKVVAPSVEDNMINEYKGVFEVRIGKGDRNFRRETMSTTNPM